VSASTASRDPEWVEPDDSLPFTFVSYSDFGEEFFRRAVTAERILGAVNVLAGQPIELGPIGVGPGRLVKVTAHGDIGEAQSEPVEGPDIAFRVVLPVALSFEVDLGLEVQRFKAMLTVPLVLTARAAEGLIVFLDILPPRRDQIGIDLRADGLRASVLNRVAGIEGEVQRFVAKYIDRELDKSYVQKARIIDVAGAIDSAWDRLGPRRPSATAAHISEDFRGAVEHERWPEDG
jgi:hypothetical protein